MCSFDCITLCIYSALDPGFLCKAFYATLTPFSDLNTLAGQSMLVQRATIESSNMPVLLLDQFTHIVVYFTQHSAQLPFPPPHDSMLSRFSSSHRLAFSSLIAMRVYS